MSWKVAKSSHFLSYAASCAQTDPYYPITALSAYDKLGQHWRSNGIAAEALIEFDLAGAQDVAAIVVNAANFAGLNVLGDDTRDWDAPAYNSGLLAIPVDYGLTDAGTLRRRAWLEPAAFPLHYAYLALRIPVQSIDDAINAFRLSSVALLSGYTELAENPDVGYRARYQQAMLQVQYPDEGEDVAEEGDRYWTGTFRFTDLAVENMAAAWAINGLGQAGVSVFFEHAGDASQAYLCRRVGGITVAKTRYGIRDIDTITLKEAF